MPDRTPDDAEWERIVASLRGPDSDGNTEWPEPDASTRDESPEPEPEPARPPDEPVIIWRGSSEDIDAEIERAIPDEHFVPPDPPPLPRADALTWAAWLSVIGAPALLLVATALGGSSRLLVVVAVVAFVAGIGVLLTRMRTQRDPYDPDDGAVV
jgi:hypothetical protein